MEEMKVNESLLDYPGSAINRHDKNHSTKEEQNNNLGIDLFYSS
jgi:hypothetical protein